MRALYIIGCFVVGALCAYVASPFIVKNDAAINIFVTVYSVLAGVLIAVIAVLGDPALLPAGSWQTAEAHRDSIDKRLIRYTWLFGLYLVTVAAIFVSTLLRDAPDDVVGVDAKEWMNLIYLWLGISAFLLSLALPKMLMEIQRARVDAEIGDRRRNQGMKS
jgi:hypothetical protein